MCFDKATVQLAESFGFGVVAADEEPFKLFCVLGANELHPE